MSEKSEKVKVQRNRKRIYETSREETSPEESTVSQEPQDLEAATTQPEIVAVEESRPHDIAEPEVLVESNEMKHIGQSTEDQFQDAMLIVRKWSAWAAGAGLVPVPLIDVVAMTAVQIAMLKKLADLYAIPFSEQRSKSAVAALIGGINAGYLGGSALKMFPLFGVLSLAVMPVVNGAITYAVGQVFIQHFASGGTFLDFDPAKVKAYFEEQYRKGK